MCAFQTDLSILKDYDTDFFQARSSEKRTLINGSEVLAYFDFIKALNTFLSSETKSLDA